MLEIRCSPQRQALKYNPRKGKRKQGGREGGVEEMSITVRVHSLQKGCFKHLDEVQALLLRHIASETGGEQEREKERRMKQCRDNKR